MPNRRLIHTTRSLHRYRTLAASSTTPKSMDAAINMFTTIQQSATSELTSVPAHLGAHDFALAFTRAYVVLCDASHLGNRVRQLITLCVPLVWSQVLHGAIGRATRCRRPKHNSSPFKRPHGCLRLLRTWSTGCYFWPRSTSSASSHVHRSRCPRKHFLLCLLLNECVGCSRCPHPQYVHHLCP